MHDNDESETVVKMFVAEILKHNVITLLLSVTLRRSSLTCVGVRTGRVV